ncbi:B12-binding domain-containing radical SAM protein [Megalodesulfovibrio gigas]|uniref:Putative Radical SAM domain protein n=1 Tax=Megalodesulfovibrio gigas (strain ATCC 19364 / DSM 1382 / NCIMB 9332 / VKM B-1759) TaxID=1121448 RepID=T2G7B9_MEGG1|nr:radical SAM protein [Megalodesulfovibrio gigas]AGW12031.1 putative Radical SAM domain protein [Megalodesulfovibrio gigas DSM 1382 = ATCC 19364]
MRVVLVSPYPDITSFGLRSLSAWLRHHGIQTRCIFLPDQFGDEVAAQPERYSPAVLQDFVECCKDADLVGITLMTNYFDNALQLTTALRQASAVPVVWGGVHATIRPEECLQHADFVCIGDGEETLLELAQILERGGDPSTIQGLWGTHQGDVFRNPVRPLPPGLDIYPPPDWSGTDHHILAGDRVTPMTDDAVREHLTGGTVSTLLGKIGYQTMTGRGCPHRCSYCINDAVKKLYGARNYLRWRSTSHVMDELESIIRQFPFIGFIWISDDAFFGRPMQDILEFCREYKQRIGLPFTCLASPLTMREDKLAALVDAGLVYLQMGVQSGSPHIQELFNRSRMNNAKLLEAMHIIHKFRDRLLPPSYDFILDAPWETDEDRRASLELISRIPKPFRLQPFSLVLYPGTALHEKATAEGLLQNERRDVYSKHYTMRAPSYSNLLISLSKTGKMPAWLLRLAISPLPWRVFGSHALEPVIRGTFLALKRLKSMLKPLLSH